MLAQYIFNQILRTPKQQKLKEKLFKFIRNKMLAQGDAIVNYQYKQFNLAILFSHDFPFNFKEFPGYSQNLAAVTKLLLKKYPNLHAIDVGANIGDSAAIMQSEGNVPVLCIEGNPKFLGLLETNTKQMHAISVEPCFVGEEEVMVKAVNNLGTAYLEKTNEGISVKTISSIIEKHAAFLNTKLFKIDTDGFDNKIIRGAKDFLVQSKSSVFFEYDPHFLSLQGERGLDIYPFLVAIGYTKFVIYDNLGDHLITLGANDFNKFEELHHYFNRGSARYMDIWALHAEDENIF